MDSECGQIERRCRHRESLRPGGTKRTSQFVVVSNVPAVTKGTDAAGRSSRFSFRWSRIFGKKDRAQSTSKRETLADAAGKRHTYTPRYAERDAMMGSGFIRDPDDVATQPLRAQRQSLPALKHKPTLQDLSSRRSTLDEIGFTNPSRSSKLAADMRRLSIHPNMQLLSDTPLVGMPSQAQLAGRAEGTSAVDPLALAMLPSSSDMLSKAQPIWPRADDVGQDDEVAECESLADTADSPERYRKASQHDSVTGITSTQRVQSMSLASPDCLESVSDQASHSARSSRYDSFIAQKRRTPTREYFTHERAARMRSSISSGQENTQDSRRASAATTESANDSLITGKSSCPTVIDHRADKSCQWKRLLASTVALCSRLSVLFSACRHLQAALGLT